MKAKKFGAVAMALAMAGTMVPMSAFAEEEETQDFNGAEVRVFGNKWNELDPDAEGDKTQYLDAAAQIEEKYNIKFVYSRWYSIQTDKRNSVDVGIKIAA
jgi:hypothetical protein